MTPHLVHLANRDDPAQFAVEARKACAATTLRHHALQLVHAGPHHAGRGDAGEQPVLMVPFPRAR